MSKNSNGVDNKKIYIWTVALLLVISILAGGILSYIRFFVQPGNEEPDRIVCEEIRQIAELKEAYTVSVKEVTITAVGDIMAHGAQLKRAYQSETDSFDFTDTFDYVRELLSEKDYTVANLETTLAGKNNGVGTKLYGYNDYPRFNSPESLADALKDAGVDFLGTANNHSMDSDISGVYSTLDYLDQAGLVHTGTARSEQEQAALCLQTINDITFGFCAFTYDTNGITVPSDSGFAVNTLNSYNSDKVSELCQRVEDLRSAGADFVIVLAHWGVEYQTKPGSHQTDLADRLFQAGADVILGSHPHVVQPLEVRQITDTDGSVRTGICIYSLGNFVSGQTSQSGPDKDLGLIMNVTFKKENGVCTIEGLEVTPTYVYRTDDVIGVVPVEYALAAPEEYPLISAAGWKRINYAHDKIISVVSGAYNVEYELSGGWYQISLP